MKDDGGRAFPIPHQGNRFMPQGMSLRDYFAAAALQGLCAGDFDRFDPASDPVKGAMAQLCYEYADAMLAERNK